MAYATLHDRLRGPIAKELQKELKISNMHALPQIEKVVINVGINKSKMDSKEMQAYVSESLMQITGQKPVFTRARKAISNFKTRQGIVVGAMVTLRGHRMEEFLDRLIGYTLPRIRDFRGVSTKLDGHGNYAIGIQDHSIFPEVPLPDVKQIFGLQIQITTTTDSDEEGRALLKKIGMPFRPEKKVDDSKQKEEAEMKRKAEEEALQEVKPEEESSEEEKKEGESAAEPTPETEPQAESDSPES